MTTRRIPSRTSTQVKSVYTDCGAHTITLWPEEPGRLIVYVSSYPLGAGPTCGDTEYLNTANPYDEDPGSPANPLHGVIQIVEVPLANPAAAQELDVQPALSYPGDPDGRMEWGEKGLPSPPFEPAAVACHDIVVHVEDRIAGAACAEQAQVWEIGANGIPDTQNPISIIDDEVSSGGTGNIPGAVDFFHSAMFNNDGTVLNTVDESFGSGCPPMTTYQPRPWNPAGGTHKTGRMFFSDTETGEFFSEFHVGDLRPSSAPGEYCSAHMGMQVMGIQRDLLVNAWYTGGVDVIDFTQPTRLKEIAYYDPVSNSGTWSAYPYTGPMFGTGPGYPRLRDGRRHQQRPRAGHGGVPDDRREARRAGAGRPPQPADDGLTASTPCQAGPPPGGPAHVCRVSASTNATPMTRGARPANTVTARSWSRTIAIAAAIPPARPQTKPSAAPRGTRAAANTSGKKAAPSPTAHHPSRVVGRMAIRVPRVTGERGRVRGSGRG